MEIQIPLILFTTLLAWSAGLFATQAIYVIKGKGATTQMIAVIASIILLAVGGVAVLFHLQHALRIFNGFGNPTSGITQELIALVVLAIFMVIYFIMLCRNNNGTVPRWLCICAIIFGVVLVVVCAHSYMMGARPAWNTVFQVGSLLGAFCGLGPATMALLCYSGDVKTRFNNFVHRVIKTYTVGIDLSLKPLKEVRKEKAEKKAAEKEAGKDTDGNSDGVANKDGDEHPGSATDKDGDAAVDKDGGEHPDGIANKTSDEAANEAGASSEKKSVKETVLAAAVAAGSEDVAELTGKLNFIAQIVDAVLVVLYIIAMTVASGEFTQVGYYFDPTGPTRGLKDTASYTPWSMKALPVTIIILVFLAASIYAAVKGKKDGNWKKWSIVIIVAVLVVAICVRVLFYILGISVYSFTDLEVQIFLSYPLLGWKINYLPRWARPASLDKRWGEIYFLLQNLSYQKKY